MNSDQVDKWLTPGANIGVLAGIALILIELDQNADLMRAQLVQERANHLVEKYDAIIHSDYWPRIAAVLANSEDQQQLPSKKAPGGAFSSLAERVGFEPTKGYKPLLVFKTSAFNRSATSPSVRRLCDGAFWPLTPGISIRGQVAALL